MDKEQELIENVAKVMIKMDIVLKLLETHDKDIRSFNKFRWFSSGVLTALTGCVFAILVKVYLFP